MLSNKEQLDIAINGSKQFHAKQASANGGEITPDTVIDGHHEMAIQLSGLSALFSKAAEYVEMGYPVKTALTCLCEEHEIDPEYTEKLAGLMDDTGVTVLKELLAETFQRKVAEFQQQKKQASAAAPNAADRVSNGINRLKQLSQPAK